MRLIGASLEFVVFAIDCVVYRTVSQRFTCVLVTCVLTLH